MGLADWFGSPKKIDPTHIQGMMTSQYTDKIGQMGDDMLDPNSGLNQAWKESFNLQAADNAYTQNRMGTQNSFRNNMSGQSGIMDAIRNQNTQRTLGQAGDAYRGFALNQGKNALGAYTTAQTADQNVGSAMAGAYGQNITNENNYNSGMGSMVTQLAGGAMMAMCDPRTKTGMKKVGIIKTTKKPINLYSFSYKGDGGRQSIGLSSTNVKKQFKSFVQKDQRGLEWINMTRLKDVLR